MAVSNLVRDQQEDHVKKVAEFAIDAVKAAQSTPIQPTRLDRGNVKIRVGFHSGPVVSSVVGTRNPRFCLVSPLSHCFCMGLPLPQRMSRGDGCAVVAAMEEEATVGGAAIDQK